MTPTQDEIIKKQGQALRKMADDCDALRDQNLKLKKGNTSALQKEIDSLKSRLKREKEENKHLRDILRNYDIEYLAPERAMDKLNEEEYGVL